MTPDPELTTLERVPCPACAEPVLHAARKCRYCGEWFADMGHWSRARDSGTPARLEEIADPFADPDRAVDQSDDRSDAQITSLLHVDAIALELSSDLADPDDQRFHGDFNEFELQIRRRIAANFGVVVPDIRVRPNAELDVDGYRLLISGEVVADGSVAADVTSVDDIASDIANILEDHLAALMTREAVAELLNVARQASPMVVQELMPNMLSLGQLRQVLGNLVREQVPIRDLSTILNALADNAVYTKDPHALSEHVRQAIGRHICSRYQDDDGLIRAFMLSPDAERAIQNAVQLNETGQILMLDPQTSQAIQHNLAEALDKYRDEILAPIIVTPPKIRRHVKSLLERHFSKIVVLSYAEIAPGVRVENLEMIEAHRPGEVPQVTGPSDTVRQSDWLEGGGFGAANDAADWNW